MFLRLAPILFFTIVCLACKNDSSKSEQQQFSSQKKSNPKYYTELPFNQDLLEKGDIILRRGSGILSNYIISVLKDSLPISHCGIIVKKDSDIHVIHSILREENAIKGITKEPIEDFVQEALLNSLVILRQKQSEKYKLEFVSKAEELLKEAIPFDPMFDIQTQEKMYCTEIVWSISNLLLEKDIFKEKVLAGNIELLSFDNFFNSEYFEVVYSDFE